MAKQIEIVDETIEQISDEKPVPQEIIIILARMLLPEILAYAETVKSETSE